MKKKTHLVLEIFEKSSGKIAENKICFYTPVERTDYFGMALSVRPSVHNCL